MRSKTVGPWGMAVLVLGMAALLGLGGCSSMVSAECDGASYGDRARFDAFDGSPRARMGCLPFPGLVTLYTAASPDELGEHSYDGSSAETTSRGVVYTTGGGFLDIAHIRNTVDLTAYIHARVSYAMRNGWGCVRFASHEPSIYTVNLDYPESWDGLSASKRAAVIDEAAIRLSQRLALEAMTWHEILTWHGYKSTVVFSEAGSAFTYEDAPSHAVGVLIAGEALRTAGYLGEEAFDAEVTLLLDQTLSDLGVVSVDEMEQAIDCVKGDWWDGGRARRRSLETGLEAGRGGRITPWVVEGLAFDDRSGPVTWEIPSLDNVLGEDCSALASVSIEPRVFETWKVMALLPEADGVVDPDRDFPVLIEAIRAEIGADMARVEPRAKTETARGR